MQELEKILEEFGSYICDELCYYRETSADKQDDEMEEICAGCKVGEYLESIRKHMNDGWIPVKERLPEVDADIEETTEDDDCPEYNVTIRGASESTTLKYSPDGAWFDDNGYVYDVIAWRPLPEPYKPERSAE